MKFLVEKKDYGKIARKTSISAFGYENKNPYCTYTSKQTFEKHVDLLLVSNARNQHYVLTKD